MKILHIGKYFLPFSGGMENYLRDAMAALQRQGVVCAALVHRHHLSVRSRFETFTTDDHATPVISTGVWARFLFTPISPAFPWQLNRLLHSFKPDVLHLHLPNPSAFWVLALPFARRLPWVVHWHADVIAAANGWQMKLFYKLYRPFEQAILKRSQAIVATSVPYRDASAPLRDWLAKCHVAPLGVDVSRLADMSPDPRASTPDQEGQSRVPGASAPALRVLAVGRLTYYKGFRYLIECAAMIRGIRVSLVGDGELAKDLRELAATLGVQDKVTFYGSLGDAELARQIRSCDCLCLPSIERTEAFGLVLLEAMYFGKPTVVSDVPGSGMGWIVDHAVTGIKVEPANTQALADAFNDLSAKRDKLVRMGQNGKRKFDQQFTIDRAILPVIDIYHEVLKATTAQRDRQPPR